MKYKKDDQKIRDLANKATNAFDGASEFYTVIQKERETNLSYYMQLALGNEAKGFSQFITSDVRDTVDWCMAQIIEIFTTGECPIRFNPVNEADVDQSELETKYINYSIMEQNKGFEILYTWFKDALISKNGVIKCFWDEHSQEEPENYENVGYDEYLLIINDPEYRVKKVEIEIDGLEQEFTPEEFGQYLGTLGMNAPLALAAASFEIKGYRVKDLSQLRIENVAPEYFVVSQSQAELDLTNTDYCAHMHFYSRNELLDEGYDYDTVMSLPMGSVLTNTTDSTIRYAKETGRILDNSAATTGGELIEVIEHYIRDADDGDPKLWRLITAANGETILDCCEVDKVPYHVITPKINPYRFYGDALADELIDLQFAKSNLWRAVFDNLKYSVSPRIAARGDVDLEALNDYTPTGIVPMGPDGEIIPISVPFVADKAVEVGAILDTMRAERTGFSRETAGLDPNSLADSTNMMGAAILNLSQTRVKMIASTFANTGVKSLYNHARELILKNEKRQRMFEYNGKFVQINPRSWFQSRSSTVKVGLGYAGKLEIATTMERVLALQEKISLAQGGLMGPIVTLDNVYNAISRGMKNSGVVDVSSFFTNPEGYQPPPPEPSVQELQIESYERTEKYKTDVKAATDIKKIEADVVTKQYEIDVEAKVSNNELIYKYQQDLKQDQNLDLSRIIERGTGDAGRTTDGK